VFSLLQFGAVIPPLTIWQEVSRLLPGYRYQVAGGAARRVGVVSLPSVSVADNVDAQADAVERIIDAALEPIERPVILFSGGVDSGLIAARAKALGKTDALLVNYSFGPDDSESRLAEAMALTLGLRFERIGAGIEDPTTCLKAPGRVYPFPFGDHSTVPTSALARAIVARIERGSVLLDGTGADGAFGMAAKVANWQRVFRIPAILRELAGSLHSRVWAIHSSIEIWTRLMRRSSRMPFLSAVLAQNALAGITYDDAHAREVHSMLGEWVGGWAGTTPACQVTAGDLAMTCANTFAQKARPVFDVAGLDVQYPFLADDAVAMGLASNSWNLDQPKAPLKRALARHVPREMVYRPKAGFVDVSGAVFHCRQFIEYLVDAAEHGPISEALRRKPIMQAAALLARGKRLPAQTLNLLWSIVFLDRWLKTV
jgi:asparagine synthetase B (glutamine-hydrolysing)